MTECQTINCPTCNFQLDETFVEQKCPRCQTLIESKFICGSCHQCGEALNTEHDLKHRTNKGVLKKISSIFNLSK